MEVWRATLEQEDLAVFLRTQISLQPKFEEDTRVGRQLLEEPLAPLERVKAEARARRAATAAAQVGRAN